MSDTPAPSDFDMLFKHAVDLTGGSQTKLAEAAGCSQNAIWAASRAKRVSADMAVRIEKATNGKISRWQFRPDLWEAPETEGAAA